MMTAVFRNSILEIFFRGSDNYLMADFRKICGVIFGIEILQ
jgi:hypothetical protein